MKYILIAVVLISCFGIPPKTHKQLFDDFHTYFEKADRVQMDQLLTNDFKGLDENNHVSFRKPEYLDYMFGWNQVFGTKWNVVSVKEEKDKIISVEFDSDIFNNYFFDGKKETIYVYSFKNDKIQSIKVDTLPGNAAKTLIFNKRFTQFYNWVVINFPGKSGYCRGSDKASAMEVKALLEKYLVTQKSN